jgi:hypothetical protein
MDSPWIPTEVSIRSVGVSETDIERFTTREICAVKHLPKCTNGEPFDCCYSDLCIYNDAAMIPKMVGAVSIATADRESHASFVSSKDCHSLVNAKPWRNVSGVESRRHRKR